MTAVAAHHRPEALNPSLGSEPAAPHWPVLLPGTELIGKAAGSGLREPPYLIRRRDGQIVQLSRLLYVLAGCMTGDDLDAIAERAGTDLDLRVTGEQVAYVAETKLAPLGLVAHRDGTVAELRASTALLALRYRIGVLREAPVNVVAALLRPLFLPPVVVAAVAGLILCDLWLDTSGGLAAGLRAVIYRPALGLALYALTLLSLLFHEFGHASACRYGGARPGRIGIGIYLVWPVFFTDVTDSYRLSKAGRLRTDLGGVYFNGLVALAAAGAYRATGYYPLLTVVASQQILMLDQFIPWVRLDGYHIVSDLIGVSDLFARIRPVIASMIPGRSTDRRVRELKPWARAAVTSWVITTVIALSGLAIVIVLHASAYLVSYWQSLIIQMQMIAQGSALVVLAGLLGVLMVLLPIAGSTLLYLLLCGGAGRLLAIRLARNDRAPRRSGARRPATAPIPDAAVAAGGGGSPAADYAGAASG